MKKISKDIKMLVDKGNFVIAIKMLSEQERISFEEAKVRIDAYEAKKQKRQGNITPNNSEKHEENISTGSESEANFDALVSSVKDNIHAEKQYPIPFAWVRLVVILLVVAALVWLAYRYI